MRILWLSNAPWAPSGYGVQTKLFCKRIRKLGHEVAVSASYGLASGIVTDEDGITVYPGWKHPWGLDAIASNAQQFGADIVISLLDSWLLDGEAFGRFPWCPWFPIDHDPCPPLIVAKVREAAFAPIVYSRFGLEKAFQAGINALYVPHGVDTDVFRPMGLAEARKALSWNPDKFIVGVVAANACSSPSRKSWPYIIEAFAKFAGAHPEAALYCHTNILTDTNGTNIPELINLMQRKHGVPDLHERISCLDPAKYRVGTTPEELRLLYSAMDVFLLPSMGEGFGVPIIEAQACGVPVIVSDWTAMSELCFSGWKLQKRTPFYTNLASYQFLPDVDEIVEALEMALERRDDRSMRDAAHAGALDYDADRVTWQFWKPVLEQIEERLEYTKRIVAHVKAVNEAPVGSMTPLVVKEGAA